MTIGKASVRRLVEKWRHILGLEPLWKIDTRICATPDECEADYHDAQAFVNVEAGYWRVTLTVNAWQVTVDDLESVIVHEMTHVALHQLASITQAALANGLGPHAEEIVESTVERISRALYRRHS